MYAEACNYWKTSKTSPDTWLAKAKQEIVRAGGEILGEAFGSEKGGRSAYMLAFKFHGEEFKVIWPVLPSKSGNDRAARIQAATILYHDVKARAVSAKVLGARTAFFSYLMLSDGRTAAQVATPELLEKMPKLLRPGLDRGQYG